MTGFLNPAVIGALESAGIRYRKSARGCEFAQSGAMVTSRTSPLD